MFKYNGNESEEGLIKREKKYTRDEIKELFDGIKAEVVLNPFGELTEGKVSQETSLTASLMTMPILNTIEKKLFGGE